MNYCIEFLPSAKRQLVGLPRDDQQRIARQLDALVNDARPPWTKRLDTIPGLPGDGKYRIVYQVLEKYRKVLVVRIAHRRELYRRLAVIENCRSPNGLPEVE